LYSALIYMGIDKTCSKVFISIKSFVCSVIFMNKFININYKIETIMFVLVRFQSEQYSNCTFICNIVKLNVRDAKGKASNLSICKLKRWVIHFFGL
jgi:hypothetical protein